VYGYARDYREEITQALETLEFSDTLGAAYLYFEWAVPDAVKYADVSNVVLYLSGTDGGQVFIYLPLAHKGTNYSNATYKKLTVISYPTGAGKYTFGGSGATNGETIHYSTLQNGILITNYYNQRSAVYTGLASSSLKPRLEVTYSGRATPTVEAMSPSEGSYAAKAAENVFSWSIGKSFPCLADFAQTSATFQWRASAGGTINSAAVSGGTQSYTLPTGAFTTSSPQWRVTVTCDDGSTVTSDWVTLNTVESLSAAEPVSPKGVVVDGSKEVVFQWRHVISTGTAQTGYDLQTSADGTTWTTRKSETTAEQRGTLAAGTLTAGTSYWRVRTYNTDSAAGAWSEAAQITVVTAPAAPGVTITAATPRAAFRWSGSGQQAYQYQIDDHDSGMLFGTASAVRSPVLLDNGQHVARVRIQNEYGLWSDWGSAGFQVTNSPGSAIYLDGTGDYAARLTWQTQGSYDAFYVYRDGLPIGKTAAPAGQTVLRTELEWEQGGIKTEDGKNGSSTTRCRTPGYIPIDTDVLWTLTIPAGLKARYFLYSDNQGTLVSYSADSASDLVIQAEKGQYIRLLAHATSGGTFEPEGAAGIEMTCEFYAGSYEDNLLQGEAAYTVVGVNDGSDYYTRSNAVTVAQAVDCKMIAPVDTWDWQALRYSTDAVETTRTYASRQAASTYFTGAAYPTPELSEFYSRAISFETAFADKEAAKAFEALLGRVVCLKTPYGDSVVGLLDTWDKAESCMYTTFAAKISKINWEDVITLD